MNEPLDRPLPAHEEWLRWLYRQSALDHDAALADLLIYLGVSSAELSLITRMAEKRTETDPTDV